tara:strand:+ start:5355 stop:6329 length:975 start_codon:yes stop_codon:yes gene_type:complete
MELFKRYKNLRKKGLAIDGSIHVDDIPGVDNHKIGISDSGYPIFFISTNDENKSALPINLKLIQVQFQKNCELILKSGDKKNGTYSVVTLKNNSEELTKYFISNLLYILTILGSTPTFNQIKNELNNLANLFQNLIKPPKSTIQGLWAELLIIEQSIDPSYLINCWHQKKSDLYDFNNGFDKLEVKSTSRSKRVHRFSLNQLQEVTNSLVIIGSVLTIETDKGVSAEYLIHKIQERLNNSEQISKLQIIISETMGSQIERIYDTFFDYSHALSSIKFFNVKDVPKILNALVPQEISNVKLDSDLTGVSTIPEELSNSDLLKALR